MPIINDSKLLPYLEIQRHEIDGSHGGHKRPKVEKRACERRLAGNNVPGHQWILRNLGFYNAKDHSQHARSDQATDDNRIRPRSKVTAHGGGQHEANDGGYNSDGSKIINLFETFGQCRVIVTFLQVIVCHDTCCNVNRYKQKRQVDVKAESPSKRVCDEST